MKVLATIFLNIIFVFLTSTVLFCQEQCLKNSWDSYNKGKWKLAIQSADDCVFNFAPNAQQIQTKLKKESYKLPANYSVPKALSTQEKKEIFEHGLLNDVATSYWIIGMSNLRLKKNKEANSAFEKAKNLTFALCYNDKEDLFWSISEAAALRLNK